MRESRVFLHSPKLGAGADDMEAGAPTRGQDHTTWSLASVSIVLPVLPITNVCVCVRYLSGGGICIHVYTCVHMCVHACEGQVCITTPSFLKVFLSIYFFFNFMQECFACMYVCAPEAYGVQRRPKESAGSPGTRVTNVCALSCQC